MKEVVIVGWQGGSNFLIQRENEDKCRKCGGKDDVCQGNYDGSHHHHHYQGTVTPG